MTGALALAQVMAHRGWLAAATSLIAQAFGGLGQLPKRRAYSGDGSSRSRL